MASLRVKPEWRMEWAFPWMGRLPTTIPWKLAHWVGRDAVSVRHATEQFLQERFRQVFPQATQVQHLQWAQAHMRMLAQEMLDACALQRIGMPGGPSVHLSGWQHVEELQRRNQGFILVLNHFDRLLTAPIALARRGLVLHNMTMPVLNNPELGVAQRDFLINKIGTYSKITGGQWRTSDEGLRPVHEGLRSGQAWVILADAWRPEFGRLRSHKFLAGQLSLPTGIERLAQSTGAALLHATTYSDAPDRLRVHVEALPQNPREAIDLVICQLEADVKERPWAWWHWGLWDQMWRPEPQEEHLVQP